MNVSAEQIQNGQYTITTPWEYPIQPGSQEWASLDIMDAMELLDVPDTEVYSPAVGDRVTYKNGTSLYHTGIVTGISVGTVYVTSKWGYCGVLTHTLTSNMYCASGATNIQYWRLN